MGSEHGFKRSSGSECFHPDWQMTFPSLSQMYLVVDYLDKEKLTLAKFLLILMHLKSL